MNDIEARIQGWRRTLLAGEGMHDELADELEDHLREEMQHLRSAALSDEETFLVATHRLGRADVIATEFEKTDRTAVWRRRWIWALIGHFGFSLGLGVYSWIGNYWASERRFGVAAYPLVVVALMAGVFTFAWWTRSTRNVERMQAFLTGKPILRMAVWLAVAAIVIVPWAIWTTSLVHQKGAWHAPYSLWMGQVIPSTLMLFVPAVALVVLLRRERTRAWVEDEVGRA